MAMSQLIICSIQGERVYGVLENVNNDWRKVLQDREDA